MGLRHKISPAMLEQVAAKLTRYSRSLRLQLHALRRELAETARAVATSHEDLRESETRLREIEELMDGHQVEIDRLRAAQTQASEEGDELRARCDELEELLEERDEELELLDHIRSVLLMQQASRAKLQTLVAGITRELGKVRRNEETIVLVALRGRLVKLPPKA